MRANKYPLPMMMRLRLARGMYWQTTRPPIPWREIGLIVIAIALLALAMELDYRNTKLAEAVAQAEQNASAERMLLACMGGTQTFSYPTERPRKGAYGKTVVACRAAEEFEL